jgi:hypothetical protein
LGYGLKCMKTFNERATEFVEKFKLLQEEYEVRTTPIITMYGPDLQVTDLRALKTDGIIEGEVISSDLIEPATEPGIIMQTK